MKVPTVAPVRWGAREEREVLGGAVVEIAQFLDLKLLAPQQLALALYATSTIPIVGLTVQWTIQVGAGSFSTIERTSVGVSDELLQVPLLLLRPANSVQVTAVITSIIPETKRVKLVAFIAPQSPTWLTDITCSVAQ